MSETADRGLQVSFPSEREIRVVRGVAAPRALVWEAWTSPEHLPRWLLGPDGWRMPVCEMDLRPGGAWRYVWRNEGGAEMEMVGEFREVSPPERLVNTERWGGEWPETLNTIEFSERDGRTTVTLTVVYPSREARDAAVRTGMNEGLEASYRRLERHLRPLVPAGGAA